MKLHASALALIAAPALGAAQGSGATQVGDVAEHVFSTPPVNAMGVTKLSDLRGKPVLIDFWGTR
jgi:hypothetical protein